MGKIFSGTNSRGSLNRLPADFCNVKYKCIKWVKELKVLFCISLERINESKKFMGNVMKIAG
jgi:hypothetical protein